MKKLNKSEFPKYVHVIQENDLKEPKWAYLKSLYDDQDHAIHQEARITITVLNALITQQQGVFLLTRRFLEELVKSDANWKQHRGMRHGSFGGIIKVWTKNGLFKILKESPKGVRKGWVWELTDEDTLKFVPPISDLERNTMIATWEGYEPKKEAQNEIGDHPTPSAYHPPGDCHVHVPTPVGTAAAPSAAKPYPTLHNNTHATTPRPHAPSGAGAGGGSGNTPQTPTQTSLPETSANLVPESRQIYTFEVELENYIKNNKLGEYPEKGIFAKQSIYDIARKTKTIPDSPEEFESILGSVMMRVLQPSSKAPGYEPGGWAWVKCHDAMMNGFNALVAQLRQLDN